jgi:tRNA-Thr(GGU) m(6)t(6)A37 methyltransferase TsaA
VESFEITAVAHVASPRREPVDDDWADVESTITLVPGFGAEALRGLGEFSHIEVVYLFHLVDPAAVTSGARCPRGNTDWPEVGIFAQRAKARPNRLGVSFCELLAVEGTTLRVRGLDAVDGTPVLDIKPCMREFAPRGEVLEPAWAEELMADYF